MDEESQSPDVTGQASHDAGWKGTARYDVLRMIGRGGMGVVYEAFDRERRQRVALKTLLHFNPFALYQFKQEFRALADVQHPNLVRLYELVATDPNRTFFAMELVKGRDFLDQAWGDEGGPASRRARQALRRGLGDVPTRPDRPPRGDASSTPPPRPARAHTPADMERLRRTLPQLVHGVHALHMLGKLHRDIKPSNVLVTPEGRVVLLDLGVAKQLSRIVDENMLESVQAGTPRYMAPEQGSDEEPQPASDWYSVGVMLYESLVGRPPFAGSAFEVLAAKNTLDPPRPSDTVDGVPEDLDDLCFDLLSRDPAARPSGQQILRRLSDGSDVAPTPLPVFAPGALAATLIGRESHLAALRAAFEAARAGHSVTVFVRGASGMGKSTLVQHFLDQLVANREAVTLRGRAYERESVPYKAVDTLIDALSRYLMRLADLDDSVTLPADVWALARLFPVLRRVPTIGAVAPQSIVDPLRARRRAFLALREFLGSLSRRTPMVLYSDDVQWGDPDSAALLLELLRPPDAPPILLVMTYREEDARTSPFFADVERWPVGVERRELSVGPLEPADARRFALSLLGSQGAAAIEAAEVVARESGGNPFLIEELARTVGHGAEIVSLEKMLESRVAQLPADARRLLEVVAVDGRPLPVAIAGDAAGVHDAVDEAVWLLRERRFVRVGFRDGREVIEISHDRVRHALLALATPATIAEHHGRLARALESTASADPESLAAHLIGAGEKARATQYAELAAEQAAQKLAFDQAIRLFQLALQTIDPASPRARTIRLRLAEVLEWAGRGAEAARVYLEAAERAPALERLDIERAAAEQLLTSGRIDEGIAVLNRVLHAAGMTRPRSPLGALLSLLAYRLWLRVRGLSFRERGPDAVAREDRARIDALYAVAVGLSVVDVVLGACMQARHLSYALRAGDRFQVIRAVSMEMAHLAGAGGAESARERKLAAIARNLAEKLEDGEALAFALGAGGIGMFLRGAWREARQGLDAAYAKYPNHRAGWHANAYLFSVYALVNTGDLDELGRRHARLIADADQRGDRYTSVNLRTTYASLMLLAADQPEVARANLVDAMQSWSHGRFLLQHWQAMTWGSEIALYEGEVGLAYTAHLRDEGALRRSLLLQVQFIRGTHAFSRARCAVASIEAEPARRKARLAEGRKLARRLEREGMPWTDALASLVSAAVANAAGDREGALDALRSAVARAEKAGMAFYAVTARYRLGALLGDGGVEVAEQATSALRAWGIVAPEKMVRMVLPGRWPGSA